MTKKPPFLSSFSKSQKAFPSLKAIKEGMIMFAEIHGRAPTPKDENTDSPKGVSWHRINVHLQEKRNTSLVKLFDSMQQEQNLNVGQDISAVDYFNICADTVTNTTAKSGEFNIDTVIDEIDGKAKFSDVSGTLELLHRGIVADERVMPSPPTSTRSFLEATGLINQDGQPNFKRAATKVMPKPTILN